MTGFPSGCLGKLPLHGDFIRYNAASPEVHDFDHWVQEGIYHGYNELDSRWDATFDAAPRARFIYIAPKTQRVVAGLFRPSVDKAGRRYPFMVYAVIEPGALGHDLAYLPWALEPYAAKAGEIAGWADSAINLNTFLTSIDQLRFEPDMGEAKRNFGRYVLGKTSGEVWAQDFGANAQPRVHAAVQSVSEGGDLRGGNALALRLPVTGHTAEVSFWLELTRRLNKAGRLPVMTMWNEAAGDAAARLHMCFGDLAPKHFLPFVLPQRDDASLRDLAGARGDAAASQLGKATFDQVLANGSLKLSDLLQRLPRCKGL